MRTYVEGEFYGFNGGAVFRLSNGEIWQQARYEYRYQYAYQPEVIITQTGGRYLMEVPCMGASIEVERVSVIAEARIVSQFSGFSFGAEFELSNGQKWRQTETKTRTRTLTQPRAVVIQASSGKLLSVSGVDEVVRVERVQ